MSLGESAISLYSDLSVRNLYYGTARARGSSVSRAPVVGEKIARPAGKRAPAHFCRVRRSAGSQKKIRTAADKNSKFSHKRRAVIVVRE